MIHFLINQKKSNVSTSLIHQSLSYIYDHSLCTGIFPDHLKIAVLKPLYKKGDKTSMTNYRPISLKIFFSKVLEKVMYSRLIQHLHTKNILITEEYCFRKGISSEDAASRLTDSVFKSLDKKKVIFLCFADRAAQYNLSN